MPDSKRDTDVKNRLLDSVGKGKGVLMFSIDPATALKGQTEAQRG